MLTRSKLRWIFLGITVGWYFLGPIADVNVEELARQEGWDQGLVESWPTIMATISTAQENWPLLVLALLLGATLTMWLFRYVPESGASGQDKKSTNDAPQRPQPVMVDFEGPNYELYDGRKRFSVLEAAFLWADCTPNSEPSTISLFPEAHAAYRLLSEAITDGDLKCFRMDKRGLAGVATTIAEPAWSVYRDDLINFANKIEKKPKFLFPEMRHWMRG